MAESSLVSVIIPTYNYAHFISEAIESVRAQTYRRFEIIVVDDGSTDETQEIVGRFSDVHCVAQTNQGIAAARNAGLFFSKGEFLVFLDADDRLFPDALEAGIHSLNENPTSGFVSGHWELISRAGEPLPTPRVSCVTGDNYRALLNANYIGTVGQVMFRRSVFADAGFDTACPGCDDIELYLRIARKSPISCHDRTVVQHRLHGSNASSNRALMLRSMLKVYRANWERVRGSAELEDLCRQGIELCEKFLAAESRKARRDRIRTRWLVKNLLQVWGRMKAEFIFWRYRSSRRRSSE